jgi:hypothetical protein
MSGISKKLGIGISAGLIIGPLIVVALIRIAHVPYLETRFAFGRLAIGLLIGAIICTLGASTQKSRLEGLSPGRIRALIAVGVLVNISETVIIIRRIIP